MVEAILVALIIFAIPTSVQEPAQASWIIWNVGQGEWVTHVLNQTCHHFDMGGEFWPKPQIKRICGLKKNFAYFSHWDLDHVGFAGRVRSALPNICLGFPPLGKSSRTKEHLFDGWPKCAPDSSLKIWQPLIARGSKSSQNERSQIYSENHLLMTGDAPSAQERSYVHAAGRDRSIRWLVLGHHGSKTSTSEELLRSLPNLKLAIASSRRGKYGHPHRVVVDRLRFYRIPLLTTEDWGSIEIRE